MILKCERTHKHDNKLQNARGTDTGITAEGRNHFILEGGTCSLITSLLSITCKVSRLRVVAAGAVRKRGFCSVVRNVSKMADNVGFMEKIEQGSTTTRPRPPSYPPHDRLHVFLLRTHLIRAGRAEGTKKWAEPDTSESSDDKRDVWHLDLRHVE